MSTYRIVILGSGTSHGIPMIGCSCPVCTSSDPRDKRTRTSVIVEAAGCSFLIDTSPELRTQCLACNITRVDAVLYTHSHADHIVGLDDLRRFNALQKAPIPCYGDAHTLHDLRRMFPYAFKDMPDYPSAKPHLEMIVINEPFDLFGVLVIPIPLYHGKLTVLGYRVGPFAYCTDCNQVPEESMNLLQGLQVLILDGLRRRPHPTHFNLEQAVDVARQVGAKQTFFTHIAHELGHEATNAELPAGMALAYDGQVIEIKDA
ncbi:MAG TPA: MBL fold metallo-hydrolase [Phycisphaerae bacterium]|mgnify:CR=1 FL=1|nr:MBL fold metallo-hydrolase [Phycisphaerae bacterium]HRR85505.1 MBL fold metallo-hydrolase [Phycisphaerae bacterium]